MAIPIDWLWYRWGEVKLVIAAVALGGGWWRIVDDCDNGVRWTVELYVVVPPFFPADAVKNSRSARSVKSKIY